MTETQDAAAVRSPERFPPDDPREWLNRARSQLGLARFDHPDVHPDLSCFSAQQAAARAIKAVLIQRDVPFPYVHDLDALLAVAEGAGETPPAPVRQAGQLTRYAEVGRELDLNPPVTAADRVEAIAIAEAVVAWAAERIADLRASPAQPAPVGQTREAEPLTEPLWMNENGHSDAPPGSDRNTLIEIVRRIVEAAAPEQVILFGSRARGEAHPSSDYDLLVVKAGQDDSGYLTDQIYRNLIGVGVPVDVVVVTPEDVERYRDAFALVIYPALREGRVVYAR